MQHKINLTKQQVDHEVAKGNMIDAINKTSNNNFGSSSSLSTDSSVAKKEEYDEPLDLSNRKSLEKKDRIHTVNSIYSALLNRQSQNNMNQDINLKNNTSNYDLKNSLNIEAILSETVLDGVNMNRKLRNNSELLLDMDLKSNKPKELLNNIKKQK